MCGRNIVGRSSRKNSYPSTVNISNLFNITYQIYYCYMTKTIAVISPIGASSFADVDADILSREYTVTRVKVSGSTKFRLLYSYIADIIPAVIRNDITYVWFADAHALVATIVGKVFGKDVVVVVGGYEVSGNYSIGYGNQISKYRRWITNTTLKLSSCIINQSDMYTRMTQKIIGENHTFSAIHPGVNTSVGDHSKKDPCVAMVASANAENEFLKGIDLYNTLAWSFRNKNIPFYLIGGYDEETKQKYPDITYMGKMNHDDLLKFLDRVKVYCQLSRSESFGVAVVEAMSRGCIPCVTDTEALPEVIGGYGHMMPLFGSTWFCEAYYEKVKSALSEDIDPEMIAYAQKFSIEDRAQKLLNLIRTVCA
jgi:glycosyltransferase involved in cell wall biosynthesis